MINMTEIKHPRTQYLIHVEELTLVGGTAQMADPFAGGEVDAVLITQKGATALTESFSWSLANDVITIDSDNATSTATVSVVIIGRY